MIELSRGFGLDVQSLWDGAASAAPYTPASAPGVVFYAVADTLSSSPVSSWSYGAGNLTQGTGASQPTWSASSANVGSQPSVLYSGSQFMAATSTSALQLTGDWTFCTVMYITSFNTFNCVISKVSGSSGEIDIQIPNSSKAISVVQYNGVSPTTVNSNSSVISSGARFLLTIIKSGTTISFRKDRSGVGSGTNASAVTATTNALQLGQRSGGSTALTGEQPAAFLSNQALAGTDLTNLENYLRTKYGTP